jgi:DNA-binding CsgD family transcriptional regulator
VQIIDNPQQVGARQRSSYQPAFAGRYAPCHPRPNAAFLVEPDRSVTYLCGELQHPALADRLAALLAGVPGLRLVGAGEAADAAVVLPPGRSPRPGVAPQADVEVPLTPRELEVLALLAEGASNKMIARRLGISVHTAKFHVGSLIDKLDAVGRTDAVAHAARLGVIHL